MKQAFLAEGCLMIAVVLVVGVVLARLVMPGTSKMSPAVSSSRSGAAPSPGTTAGPDSAVPQYEDSVDIPEGTPQPSLPLPAQANSGTRVIVNGLELSRGQVAELVSTYRTAVSPGRYWYDSRSGAWGLEGRETAGFLTPGHEFGPVAPNASNGDTGVIVNGRELPSVEVMRLQMLLGQVGQGRWWLDGNTGYFGAEGNPRPLGNLLAAMQAQSPGKNGDAFWCSVTACGNDDGKSGYVDVDGTIVGYDH
jgi:hypothetical protein